MRDPQVMMCPHMLVQLLRPLEKLVAANAMICESITRLPHPSNGVPVSCTNRCYHIGPIRLGLQKLIYWFRFPGSSQRLFVMKKCINVHLRRDSVHLATLSFKVDLKLTPFRERTHAKTALWQSIHRTCMCLKATSTKSSDSMLLSLMPTQVGQ